LHTLSAGKPHYCNSPYACSSVRRGVRLGLPVKHVISAVWIIDTQNLLMSGLLAFNGFDVMRLKGMLSQ
jgi:hypothetical protein